MKERYWKRKRYFVDPSLQLGYMVVILITMVITGAVIYFSIWSVFLERISQLQAQTRVVLLFKDMVGSVFSRTNRLLSYYLPILFGLIVLLSIFFSHRIAGPLYRIDRDLDRLIKKGLFSGEIKLRRYDHTRIIAFSKSLNRLVTLLKERIGIERDLEKRLTLLVERMDEGPSLFPQVKKELATVAAEIQKSIKNYK